jgi:hypothetical protein
MVKAGRASPYRNPFYSILIATGVAFVVTALAYLVSPTVIEGARSERRQDSPALARWLDRQGPTALGVELVAMLVAGVAAMATDSFFTARARDAAAETERG